MQRVNIDVFCWPFVLLFFGAPIACTALALPVVWRGDVAAPYVIAAATLMWVGAMLVTGRGNVPLNDALARVDPGAPDAAARWVAFYARWMFWNHVRLLACAAAAALLLALAAR